MNETVLEPIFHKIYKKIRDRQQISHATHLKISSNRHNETSNSLSKTNVRNFANSLKSCALLAHIVVISN
jgi:hypothetical protein